MNYIGIDLHKNYSFITKMDEKGRVINQIKVVNNPIYLGHFLDTIEPDDKMVLETTWNWYYFYEMVEDKNLSLYLAHPKNTKAIASAKIKTDKIDSYLLAHLLRADLLPTAYIPTRDVRDTREFLRYRASLVAMRSMIKNKVHAILSKNGLRPHFSDIFGKRGLRYLKNIELRHCYRQALNGYLKIVEVLNQTISEVTETIQKLVKKNPQAMLLTTMPGISYYSALLILMEIGNIDRFPSDRHLCSYGGLVPSVHSSGGKIKMGSITKEGSKWLRWILIELSCHAAKGSIKFNRLYQRVSRKYGKATARVAVARQMLKVIYHMLKNNEPFRAIPVPKQKSSSYLHGVMTQ